jgi:GcrA cell cycle regulator
MVTIKHEDKKVKAILELWGKGLTGKQIGEKLGMTRSAVLGKIARLRKWGLAEYRDPASKKNATPEEKRLKKLRNPVVPNLGRKKLPPLPPVDEETRPITLLNLRLDSCRFVINDSNKAADFLFCGQPKHIGSYCKEHHAICYIKAEPRKRGKERKPFQLNPRYSEAK